MKSTGDEATPLSATQQENGVEGADENTAFFAKPVKIRSNRRQPRPPQVNGFGENPPVLVIIYLPVKELRRGGFVCLQN